MSNLNNATLDRSEAGEPSAGNIIHPSPVLVPEDAPAAARRIGSTGLSYKFQRLREKIRQAITSGELSEKLPGERALARRFHVNAKTLSKALTDLAAEGVLDRSIGRGTYVKGHAPLTTSVRRWLVVCEPAQVGWDVVQMIRSAHPEMEVATDVSSMRPSFLNQFAAVIDLAYSTPDSFLRSLVVRNIPVMVVGREPRTYSTHAVLFDGQLAVSQLGRDLLLGGHTRLAAVEPRHCTVVADTLRKAAARYSPGATVDGCFPADVPAMVEAGVTAFICQSTEWAKHVKEQLEKRSIPPGQISLGAVGSTNDEYPCSGFYVRRAEKAAAIVELLNDAAARPTMLWLAGRYVDRGTITPLSAPNAVRHSTYAAATV